MGIYYSGVSKRTVMIDGKRAAFTNFFGKAPLAYWGPDRRWSTFETKSENAAYHHNYLKDSQPVTFLIYGNKLEDGLTVAWYRPRASVVDDGYWDRWSIGVLKKVGRKWTIERTRSRQLSEHAFKRLKFDTYVTDVAQVSYREWDNRYVFSPRPDIGMSEHSLDADCTDLDRLNAHFAGYCEVASEKF